MDKFLRTSVTIVRNSIKVSKYERMSSFITKKQIAFFSATNKHGKSNPIVGNFPPRFGSQVPSFRAASSGSESTMEIATYQEVKDLPNHPEKVLIDVREPNELQETGQIPTSINIPLGTLESSLKLTPEEFKAKFGREKPSANQEVIFHCKLGGRAQKAADLAKSLGFNNARNYKGSWTEWAQKEGL